MACPGSAAAAGVLGEEVRRAIKRWSRLRAAAQAQRIQLDEALRIALVVIGARVISKVTTFSLYRLCGDCGR